MNGLHLRVVAGVLPWGFLGNVARGEIADRTVRVGILTDATARPPVFGPIRNGPAMTPAGRAA